MKRKGGSKWVPELLNLNNVALLREIELVFKEKKSY
jgi:hypothetical protein